MSSGPPPPPVRTRLDHAGLTDVGRQRKHNEDCVLIKAEHGLFCVADGMGGHNAGDVASKLVTTSLGNFFEATGNGGPIGDLPEEYAALAPAGRRLAAGVRKANHDVFTISSTVQQHHGMGSTCVAVHLAGDDMVHIAHVGDSRCYRIRDGEIKQMTRDHSLINDALDMKPDLTKEELARLPKNIITRALGMKDAVKVDVKTEPTLPGDVYLLCSDGLTGMVPPDQILEIIGLTPELTEACDLLIAQANEAGGTDNISALLVRVEEVVDEPAVVETHEVVIEADADAEAETDVAEVAAVEVAEVEAEAEAEDDDDDPATNVVERRGPPPAPSPLPVSSPLGAAMERPADDDWGAPLSGRAPVLEVMPEPLDEVMTPEELAALALVEGGGEVDLDFNGPWPGRMLLRRCPRCSYELFPGNRFCVECGARIEAASA
jgi:protein phosphatase